MQECLYLYCLLFGSKIHSTNDNKRKHEKCNVFAIKLDINQTGIVSEEKITLFHSTVSVRYVLNPFNAETTFV